MAGDTVVLDVETTPPSISPTSGTPSSSPSGGSGEAVSGGGDSSSSRPKSAKSSSPKGSASSQRGSGNSAKSGIVTTPRQFFNSNKNFSVNNGYNSAGSSPGESPTSGTIRTRSLFTAHSLKGGAAVGSGAAESRSGPFSFSAPEFAKYSPRASMSRDWIHSHFADPLASSNYDPIGQYLGGSRGGRERNFRPRVSADLLDDESPYYLNEVGAFGTAGTDAHGIGANVTSQGIISLKLHSGIQVDTTIDKGIRVLNNQSQIIIALSPDGNSAALIHPSGLVYAYGSRVEITTTDCNGNTKFAKMFYKGVSFTSDTSALVYLVDQAGTRTTSDTFSDLSGDFSIPVFLHDAQFGPQMMRQCTKIIRQAQYWITEDGTENWVVNGIRISQAADGLVRVGRGTSKYQIRTSPTNGTATITTPSVHTTASIGGPAPGNSAGPHLFVKRGERRLHSDGLTFIVRNAGHASGLDEYNQLKVY